VGVREQNKMLQSMALEELLFSRTAQLVPVDHYAPANDHWTRSVKYLPLEDAVGTQAKYLLYDKVFLGEYVPFYKEL
jgi:hypothetical protein